MAADKFELATCEAYSDPVERADCLKEFGIQLQPQIKKTPVVAQVEVLPKSPKVSPGSDGVPWFTIVLVSLAILIAYDWLRRVFGKPARERVSTHNKPSHQPVGQAVVFKYCDRNGNVTKREVRVTGLNRKGRVTGHCMLRDDVRTFYLDRIEGDVIDAATGEIMSPYEWARSWRME